MNHSDFHQNKYIILKKAVKENFENSEFLNNILGLKTKTRSIFQRPGKKNDLRRKQVYLDKKTKLNKNYLDSIENIIKEEFPNHNPVKWSMIYSKAGCSEQAPHFDYDPEIMKIMEDKDKPVSILVALQDNTTLSVFEKSETLIKKVILLSRGDILLFRGDCIHAGSGYINDNVRLHCYFESENAKAPVNDTWVL